MKPKFNLKFFLIGAGIISALSSCSYTSATTEDKEGKSVSSADIKSIEKVTDSDEKFLTEAAVINLTEIQLGQLAQKMGKMDEIKAGKMMEQDHSNCSKELKTLAEGKGITIPTSLTDKEQEEYTKLSGMTGDDFDKEYCSKMVKGHQEAIRKFEKASTDSKDADIRNFASNTLPALRMHLEHAKNCQTMLEKQKS